MDFCKLLITKKILPGILHKSIVLLLALPFLLLSSCEEDITLDLPKYDSKLAVYCILQADSIPVLYLNQSKSYFDYSDTVDALKFVKDALVIISDENNNKDTLKLNKRQENTGRGFVDIYFYEGKHKTEAGKKYFLYISQAGRQVSSETKVPNKPDIVKIELKENEHDATSFELVVWVKDIGGEKNYYNVRGLTDFSSSDSLKQLVNLYSSELDYNSDEGYDGKDMPIGISGNYYLVNPDDTISVEGRVVRASKETGEYFFTLNLQQEASDDPFSEPVVIQHNITGGLGVFGAISQPVRFRYKIR
jgi:hypothetical protein